MCCTCGLYHKQLNSSKWFCFSSPDTVPVRDGHHEGRLSGRRAERKQPNADVQQRATGQEKHGHLISQTWRVHTVFISMFHFLQYTSFMSLLKMLSVLDRDSQSKRLWVFLMIKPVNKCAFICKSTRLVLLRSNQKRFIKTPLLDLKDFQQARASFKLNITSFYKMRKIFKIKTKWRTEIILQQEEKVTDRNVHSPYKTLFSKWKYGLKYKLMDSRANTSSPKEVRNAH